MTRLDYAKEYLNRGYTPLPVPLKSKNPGFRGWQKYSPANGQVERDFDGDGNIGLLLGKPSNGLSDTDLDWPEAVALAGAFLPATEMKSGRDAAPFSHWWFESEGAKTEKWIDPNKPEGDDRAMIVELRSTGGQTIVAPSTHPSGDAYIWHGGLSPAKVDAPTLKKAASRLAACALITRYWPGGTRHQAALALAGALLRNGWSRSEADNFILSAASAAFDEELGDRARAIADTEERLRAGENVTGIPTLVEIFGQKTVDKLVKWLELDMPAYERTASGKKRKAENAAAEESQQAGEEQAEASESAEEPDGVEEDQQADDEHDDGLRKVLLDGKLILELKLNPRGAPTLKASNEAGLLHIDRVAIDKDGERKKFVKALALNDDEQKEVLKALSDWAVTVGTSQPKAKNGAAKTTAWRITDAGVFAKGQGEDGEDVLICSKLEITAKTRDNHGSEWGRLLEWDDDDGVRHIWAMPMSLLKGDGLELRAELLSGGLTLETKRKARELLNSYLQSYNPGAYARCVPRIGWYGDRNFILPDTTFGDETEERVVLQSSVDDYRLNVSGTLEEWREQVSHYAVGNSRLVFGESASFAAPLLRPLGQEGGGFNFRGQSSTGKSTSQIVAGSVFGGGDPQYGYARTWLNTANALDATAEQHNDGILLLDELALCDPKEAGSCAYRLAGGQGKARLQSSIKMRKQFKWYLLFLSSSEISLADHVAQVGKQVRGGQEARFVELPADAGCGLGAFEDIHDFASADAFAQHLQRAAKKYYGAAIRAYLQELIPKLPEVKAAFKNFEQACLDDWLPKDKQVSGEVSRVARRFALAAYGGELATSSGITGWTEGEATRAAKRLFSDWLEHRGTSGSVDEERAVTQVRAFLEKYGVSRFETSHIVNIEGGDEETADDERNQRIVQRAGFIREDGDVKEFCILREVFKREVCVGYDPAIVAKALAERGHLVKDASGKFQVLRRPPGGKTQRVYAVLETILQV